VLKLVTILLNNRVF